jgi:hypothetical protein
MPIVVQYTTNVGVDVYDEVVTEIQFHDDLPDGLIFHTAAINEDGRMRIFDVWRTREAYEHFDGTRLRPALSKLLGQDLAVHATDLEVHELHSLVSPVQQSQFG